MAERSLQAGWFLLHIEPLDGLLYGAELATILEAEHRNAMDVSLGFERLNLILVWIQSMLSTARGRRWVLF